jgi:hypothetical protein
MLWLMSWLVRRVLYALRLAAPVRLVHHAEPVSLVYVDQDGEKRRSSLAKVLEKCPSLTGPDNWYCPTPWLARQVPPILKHAHLRTDGPTDKG